MRKPAFCICENIGAGQLDTADQHLCFPYIDSTIPLLSKSEISSLYPSSVAVEPCFVSDQVGNPNSRFSHYTTRITLMLQLRSCL